MGRDLSELEVGDGTELVAEPATDTVGSGLRLIVAPCMGQFVPAPAFRIPPLGQWIDEGAVVGEIKRLSDQVTVSSPHRGRLMGMLALPWQRVRQDEPLAWLQVSEGWARSGAGTEAPTGERQNQR